MRILCHQVTQLYLLFHLVVIYNSAVCCERVQGREKRGNESKRKVEVLLHPGTSCLNEPPSLSAHLSPAGLAAQGPQVGEEVCCTGLCVCVCVCVHVLTQNKVRTISFSVEGSDKLGKRILQLFGFTLCSSRQKRNTYV